MSDPLKTGIKIAESLANLQAAERAVEDAKKEHRLAFRKALAALFQEYDLYIEADGYEGATLSIVELNGRAVDVGDLPE